MAATPLIGISSMATRALLADAVRMYAEQGGPALAIEAVGGVDAARRVEAGAAVDTVLLAADALDRLAASGHLLQGSLTPFVRSAVAVAVPAGAALPDLSNAAAVRAALLEAPTIGYSTGPSGNALLGLFARWGVSEEVKSRLVQAPAGIPVARLVAEGRVAVGLQQRSELLNQPGITLVGDLPAEIAIVTVFSGAVAASSRRADEVRHWLRFLAGPLTAELKQRHGMTPA